MPGLVRSGDKNASTGIITNLQVRSVLVNGAWICVEGDSGPPDTQCSGGNPHCSWVTVAKRNTVLAEGRPVIVIGDVDTCGDPRVEGSLNVKAYE